MTGRKIKEERYHREIDKYFGILRGKIGTMEEINENILKHRIPRPERDPFYYARQELPHKKINNS